MDGGVLLINMPFGGADRPPIGLGLLKAAVNARGIPCHIENFNIQFADWIGPALYYFFSDQIDHSIFGGDWLFARHYFGDLLLDVNGYLRHIQKAHQTNAATIHNILSIQRFIAPFIDHCLQSIDWQRYSIIGFTSTFEQNMASLALAAAIKERYPNKIIVMGGANCDGPMGLALHRCFPCLDYVFRGEADRSFPLFVERVYQRTSVTDIAGLIYRNGRESISTGDAQMITDMDSLPYPDYQDYFNQLRSSNVPYQLPLRLQVETSRGCWWGAKQHCTFCGLNAQSMAFRAKSRDRALNEIIYLSERYQLKTISAVDNIMDMRYFRELLPELKRRKLKLSLFYEVKANLTKEQVKLLSEAGVDIIQPGIESMHIHVLRLMRKGITPLQNIQLLKWCKEFRIHPTWNLIYGFPGELPSDYSEMMQLLELLDHLPPPDSHGQVRLDRFSPYFQNPTSFGLINTRPLKVYQYIYPFAETDLADIAYFYQYDYADDTDPDSYINPIMQRLAQWRITARQGADLRAHLTLDEQLLIEDSRPTRVVARVKLNGWQQALYQHCDQVRAWNSITRWLNQHYPEIAPVTARAQLERWVELKLTAKDGDNYLSLAIIPAAAIEPQQFESVTQQQLFSLSANQLISQKQKS